MKAGILEKIEQLVVGVVPDPQLESGSVIIRVKVCSICSADLRIYHYGHPRIELPHILGHEIAGEIEAVDGQVTAYSVGDRVAITPRISCDKCFYCRRGQHIYCLDNLSFGYQLPGGYAEYLLVPRIGVEYGVINKVPDGIDFEEAAFAEALACCLRAQKESHVHNGDRVVVVGGGPVGIMHSRLAKARDATGVILIERKTERLGSVSMESVDRIIDSTKEDVEAEVMAITDGNGADVVIVACSSAEAQEQALSLVGRGGRINFFGGLPLGQSSVSVDSNLIHYGELFVHGSHGSTPDDNKEALEMLATKLMRIDDLITHRFSLDAIGDAFLFAERREGMHVAVLP